MIYLSLGTNLGDREWNLDRARALLAEALRTDLICSETVRTKAVGFDGPDFLNQVVAFQSEVGPEELLDICQGVEKEMGRDPHEAEYDAQGRRVYHDRVIDVDILLFNDRKISTPRLAIPHPQVEERTFIQELLKEI